MIHKDAFRQKALESLCSERKKALERSAVRKRKESKTKEKTNLNRKAS